MLDFPIEAVVRVLCSEQNSIEHLPNITVVRPISKLKRSAVPQQVLKLNRHFARHLTEWHSLFHLSDQLILLGLA